MYALNRICLPSPEEQSEVRLAHEPSRRPAMASLIRLGSGKLELYATVKQPTTGRQQVHTVITKV